MIDVAPKGLHGRTNTMILQTKLLTGLFHDGCYLGVVPLINPGEEVVGGLVVESPSGKRPEPAVSGVVLSCGHLHLSPGAEEVEHAI